MTTTPFIRITQRGRYFTLTLDAKLAGERITLRMHNYLRKLAEVAQENTGAPEYARTLFFTPTGGTVGGLEIEDAQRLAEQISAYLTQEPEGAA